MILPLVTTASRLPVAALVLGVALSRPAAAAAQQPMLDEGTLVISRGGTPVGKESFRIMQSADGGRLYTASAQVVHGDRRLSPSLSADGTGNALLYRVEVRGGSQVQERVQATARPGRLRVEKQTPGGEASKEYVVGGGAVVLDADVFHHYALLALGRRAGAVTVVAPRTGTQESGKLTDRGSDPVTIDGRSVPATRWTLELPDGAHDFWCDSRGRLLKVAARGLIAVREEVP
jgi:hypothetical protein